MDLVGLHGKQLRMVGQMNGCRNIFQKAQHGSVISHWNMDIQVKGKIPQEHEGGVQKVQISVISHQQVPVVFPKALGQTSEGFVDKTGMYESAVQFAADHI